MDSIFLQMKKQKLTLKKKCSCCNYTIGKRTAIHTCKACKKVICGNCKQGKMILPGYENPKTVCINCWKRIVSPPEDLSFIDNCWQESDESKRLMKEIVILVTTATEFLAQGGFYYAWEVLCEHIVTGFLVYHDISNGEEINDKQNICDLCWYLWARSIGKRCPFESGTIFIEDENYMIFNCMSLLGYSRVILRGDNVVTQKIPYSMRIGSSHLSDFIEFCENKAQWLLPEGETKIVMSKGRIGRGYEQVGIDFIPGKDGVSLALPFNRHHLLFGKVPLKSPDQNKFTFLKFENYGTEAFSDIVLHGIRYGLHVVKRDREGKLPSRRETVGKKIMNRFQELVQLIFEFPSLRPIIKHDSLEQVLDRACVKGVSYIFQISKTVLIKLNSFLMNPHGNSGPLSAIQELYNQTYSFLDFLLRDPTFDHLDVRFGKEVIFDAVELESKCFIVEPQRRTVEDVLPIAARRRGFSDSMIPRLAAEYNDTDGVNRFERL